MRASGTLPRQRARRPRYTATFVVEKATVSSVFCSSSCAFREPVAGLGLAECKEPGAGTPVPSRIAIASTDYIAADRVALEAMGIDARWVGYLVYCGQVGLGQYDLAKIDLLGAPIASVKWNYRLHPDIQRELQWMGPMQNLPPIIGRVQQESNRARA
jgi:hypothetical protein